MIHLCSSHMTTAYMYMYMLCAGPPLTVVVSILGPHCLQRCDPHCKSKGLEGELHVHVHVRAVL